MSILNLSIEAPFVHPSQRAPALRAWMKRLWSGLKLCHERSRQRRHLLELDDHLLRDIGISREQAMREARKSYWS
jgi:uncharacterized protein YjiS (DUF1127 family)